MACEHADSCVVCLREALESVRKERDVLLATLEQLVGLRKAVLQKELSRPQAEATPAAMTPPDRPMRKTAEKIRKAVDQLLGPEKRGDKKRDKKLEDLAERAENLDPHSPRNSAPRPVPETVEEGRFDPPKPTAPYENPWKKAVELADAGQIALGIMAEGVQKKVGQEIVQALQEEQRKQEKQRKPPRRGRSKRPKKGPAGRQRKASPPRGSV